jgi:hypothetical protein
VLTGAVIHGVNRTLSLKENLIIGHHAGKEKRPGKSPGAFLFEVLCTCPL